MTYIQQVHELVVAHWVVDFLLGEFDTILIGDHDLN